MHRHSAGTSRPSPDKCGPGRPGKGPQHAQRGSALLRTWPIRWQPAEQLATLIGLIDVVAYLFSCLGFPLCGSALAMTVFAASGQIFTALTRSLLLKRALSPRQQQAVAVVVVGLVIRAQPWRLWDATTTTSSSSSGSIMLGVLYLAASALLYSLLGVLYEKLLSTPGNPLTHVEVNKRISLIGVVALSGYQLLFTWPRRQALVLQPFARSGLRLWQAVLLHAAFGGLFTMHSGMQGRVLGSSGAMVVGIVNAMRAATVTAASALLFCSPTAPHQCLSVASAVSAVTISTGVLLWATAPAQHLPPAAKGGAEQVAAAARQKEE